MSANYLNQTARPIFRHRMVAPFVLDEEGQKLVIELNEKLNASYVVSHDFPRPSIFFDELIRGLRPGGDGVFRRAIDVCCGTGFLARELSRRGVVEQCIAIDINKDAITELQKKVDNDPTSSVVPLQANFLTVSLDERVDLIIGNSFLHHFPNNPAFLTKCRELLKPEGVLYLCHEPTMLNDPLENPLFYLARLLGRNSGFPLTDIWQYSKKSMIRLLNEAGFKNVEIHGFCLFWGPLNWLLLTVWKRLLHLEISEKGWEFLFRMMVWERKFFSFLPADCFSSFCVRAW